MSRIGRKLIDVPAGVTIQPEGSEVTVKGPKGVLKVPLPRGIQLEKRDGHYLATRENDEQAALHGLFRSLLANAVHGVAKGFEKHLDIVGIGYRAEVKERSVVFTLGYSHPIEFALPEGVKVTVEKQTHLVVSGADKQQVGQIAAEIRALRPPDPYKNKGVRYTGERLKKKVGKAAAASGGAAKA
ncbi:MAG TPA: 50S ribosomal protein L6 [Terriglobia bacterium]|jgi:large subunit ribosomal protein L6|nr:50S ribosomal protein L6 [Terriglobia bacterium]